MARYILRRILQIVPTVFGVIVITFVLFNVVGGSPAMMTLGKNASPRALEEFDEVRGFNKPLFCGRWTGTRAFSDDAFRRQGALWRDDPAVKWSAAGRHGRRSASLAPGCDVAVPLAFSLRENTVYRWKIRYRLAGGGAVFRIERGTNSTGARQRETWPLEPAKIWREADIAFSSGSSPASLRFIVSSRDAPLEIAGLSLRRKTAHYFDSQFVFYLLQIARFDFGKSNYSNQRVSRMLAEGIGPSLALTVPIFIIGLVLAVSISLVCAFFRDTWLDRMFVAVSIVLMSVNYLVWIIAGQYFFAYRLGWFPIWGFESLAYLALPVLVGVVSSLGDNLRFYRTIMLDEMYRDYVRTAFAKGVGRGGVLFRHVLKNAMIPILTNVIIAIPFLYTGSLLLESFFGIPGLGNMGINAINYSDVDVVRALVFIGSLLYVSANLVTDVCYALVDPRVRLG